MSEINILDKTFTLMIDSQTISNRIDILADQLNIAYENKNPVFICVLKGSFMFMSDLLKKIKCKCSVNFIQISSYQDTKTTGTIKEVLGLTENISDKDVIIIEDIVDTGNTYDYLQNYLNGFDPSSCVIATLFYKSAIYLQKYTSPPDYYAFDIPDKFIVGYGLDYNQYGRNYKDIYELV